MINDTSMISFAEPTQDNDLSETFAPIYWGLIVSLVLCGIAIVQALLYFSTQKDRTIMRAVVALMLLLDIASSCLIAQSVYYYLVPHFGSLLPLNSVTPELSAECLFSTLITYISQMYFVYQLYVVKQSGKRRWIVLGSISASAFFALAGGIACSTSMYIFRHGVLANRNKFFSIFFGIAKGSGALADILATIAMCVFLTTSKTGVTETTTLLNRLLRFVMHRGALVTLFQAALLVSFYAAPEKLYWLSLHINVTKLYANTFFATLNVRRCTRSSTGSLHKIEFHDDTYHHRPSDVQEDSSSKEPPFAGTSVEGTVV